MSGQSGKGNSSAQTTQNVSNQQVAAQSGIALGSGAQGNEINISTADPEVARTAIAGNVQAGRDALTFAGHAADVAAETNRFTSTVVREIAGGSILAQNELATKFGQSISDIAAQNVGLLQSVGNSQTDVALKALDNEKAALGSAFGVSAQVAPQTDNFTATSLGNTVSKTVLYVVIGIAAIFGLYYLNRKKS